MIEQELKELEELENKSTPAIWYAHPIEKQVRGPCKDGMCFYKEYAQRALVTSEAALGAKGSEEEK